jgi:allantoin racemase
MRFLLINPNTTAAITERLVSWATRFAPGVEFVGATGRFGASYIASRAAYAIAAHAALDAWAQATGPFDGVVLACFGDPGLEALRELAPVPVIGMADASLQRTLERTARVSIVTGGARWRPMLQEFVMVRGVRDRVASIRTVEPTGGAIASDPASALPALREACMRCVEEAGAGAVILGGAGLVGLSEELRDVRAPVVDGLQAAIDAALARAELPVANDRPDAVMSVGLSSALADRLQRR